jgi:hypothetical protein
MPEVIQIRPKGIYVNIEFSLEEIKLLRNGLDRCELRIDKDVQEEIEIEQFFGKKLYPMADKLIKDLEDGS